MSRLFLILKFHITLEIMERFNGIDLDSARKVAGNGFYYLMGDIARLHSAVIYLCKRFHDQQRIYLLYSSVYDPQQCCDRCYELCRNGCNDV